MPKAILYRNDECDGQSKSAIVYRNFEFALRRFAQAEGREVHSNFRPEILGEKRPCTMYRSIHSVIAIGLASHERLSNVIRTSLIYLDPKPSKLSTGDDIANLLNGIGSTRKQSRVRLLGDRARKASVLIQHDQTAAHDLPPLNLNLKSPRTASAPRLAVINHLDRDCLARTIVGRLIAETSYFIDGYGMSGESHNRTRYLGDDQISDTASWVHIHIGSQQTDSERLRICDSWQSRVPVLHFDLNTTIQGRSEGHELKDGGDVLRCNTYNEASDLLTLLLETPSLYNQLIEGGRASVASAAQSWQTLVQELAA
ncbi:hypothetical protein MKK69_22150 [Methylobacterium sp. J-026]|uniref:hypothetical protein n=1 Tax=Methylobacterium sp. J-026 TaxID=2836624 RepID=UPI001FBA0475|nr:hypothetical protein [Methylobacterium sp. J-026]MCJ2136717.1 hypothetical protein [Methylobacterium sp. J-026]